MAAVIVQPVTTAIGRSRTFASNALPQIVWTKQQHQQRFLLISLPTPVILPFSPFYQLSDGGVVHHGRDPDPQYSASEFAWRNRNRCRKVPAAYRKLP